jgi:hypothetical protein
MTSRGMASLGLLALGLGACGPPDGSGGSSLVRVMAYQSSDGTFVLADRRLETTTDLASLQGATAQFRGGARLVWDERQIEEMAARARGEGRALDCDDVVGAFVRDVGNPPSLSFVEDDGVLVPEDYDTLVMVSTYYNFELSRDFFLEAGVPPDDLGAALTFYEPTLTLVDRLGNRTFTFDNAAYIPCADAFVIFAGRYLQDIPLGANPGVAAHEYGHLVFDHTLFGLARDRVAAPSPGSASAAFLAALNEGMADFFGASILGDANFAGRSLSPDQSDARDLDPGAVFSPARAVAALAGNPYALGSVWGSLLWDISLSDSAVGSAHDVARLGLDAVIALQDGRATTYANENMIAALIEVAASRPDPKVLTVTCAAINARFDRLQPDLTACPPR